MNYLGSLLGLKLPIKELQLTLSCPTMEDIGYMGEQDFFTAMQLLCLDKDQLVQDKTLLSNLSNFQVLMEVLKQTRDAEKKTAITNLLMILLPEYKTAITPNGFILFKEGEQPKTIDEGNFDIFQAAVKEVLCVNSIFQGKHVVYNPANSKAKAIADKLMRGRQKVAAQTSGQEGGSVFVQYLSILTVRGVLAVSEWRSLTLFALFDLIQRNNLFIDWDIDLRVRLAGGSPDSKVEPWTKNLY